MPSCVLGPVYALFRWGLLARHVLGLMYRIPLGTAQSLPPKKAKHFTSGFVLYLGFVIILYIVYS